MATKSKTAQSTSVKLVKSKDKKTYSLHIVDMTEDEARALVTVANAIGGDPKGLRGLFDDIRVALYHQRCPSESLDSSVVRTSVLPTGDITLHFNR